MVGQKRKPRRDNKETSRSSRILTYVGDDEFFEYVKPAEVAKRIADRAFAKHKDELVPKRAQST